MLLPRPDLSLQEDRELLEGRDCISRVLGGPSTISCWKQNQPRVFPVLLPETMASSLPAFTETCSFSK